MAIVIIKNLTANPLSYLSGAVTVSASGTTNVSAVYTFPIAKDPGLLFDCSMDNVFINDGFSDYAGQSAIQYLAQVATSIGGAVVGLAGNTAPSYQITVGGKDSASKSQPMRMNQFTDLSVNFRNSFSNLTGNATTTVKSGTGTLHGILINDNSTGGTIVVYDNTAGSGTKIGTFSVGTPSGGLLSSSGQPGPVFLGPLGLEFATGLTIVTSGSSSNNITIVYQ